MLQGLAGRKESETSKRPWGLFLLGWGGQQGADEGQIAVGSQSTGVYVIGGDQDGRGRGIPFLERRAV